MCRANGAVDLMGTADHCRGGMTGAGLGNRDAEGSAGCVPTLSLDSGDRRVCGGASERGLGGDFGDRRCTAWNLASGRPNWTRLDACSIDNSTIRSIAAHVCKTRARAPRRI